MKTKRLFAAVLCAAMVLALLPATAFAAGGSAIQLGTSGIGEGDKIYFGKYGTYDVPWIVLGSTALSQTSVASEANVLPLLSQYLLGTSQFRASNNLGYYNYSTVSRTEDSSILKKTMEDYYNGANKLFVTAEQNAVVDTELAGRSLDIGNSQAALSEQKLFPLSLSEAGSFTWGSSILKAKDRNAPEGGAEWWWLRTASVTFGSCCSTDGTNGSDQSQGYNGVRPAFNLDTSKVLFASAAVGGKDCTLGTLNSNMAPSAATEWKLTLQDAGRSGFSIATTALSSASATVDYAGAKTGTNEYISAVIVDNGSVAYYGRIMQLDGTTNGVSGTVTISIPTGVTLDADTQLKVFNEQFNGDRTASVITDSSRAYTDYASELKTVTAPAPVNAAPTASSVAMRGSFRVGETLTGNYTYSDTDGDLEGTSTFK